MQKYKCFTLTSLFLILTGIEALAQQKPLAKTRIIIIENSPEKRVDVTIDGKPFTSYIYPDDLAKPVLYPIRTVKGNFITRGWPINPRPGERVDHPHHIGMWFNYGDVNGLDFWNNSTAIPSDKKNSYGSIKHQKVNKIVNGNDKAVLEITANWKKPDGTNLLLEETRFVFSEDGNDRIIERISTLTALKENVLFKDNKEGMLGIRLTRELEHPSDKSEIFTDAGGNATPVAKLNNEGVTGKYISSEGKEGDAVWGTRGKWVNLTGTIKQEPVSLIILDHPQNIGFPTYWHARGYGLYAANPLGQKALSNGKEELNFNLEAGKSVTFRYKIIIHSGSHYTKKDVNREFGNFTSATIK